MLLKRAAATTGSSVGGQAFQFAEAMNINAVFLEDFNMQKQ